MFLWKKTELRHINYNTYVYFRYIINKPGTFQNLKDSFTLFFCVWQELFKRTDSRKWIGPPITDKHTRAHFFFIVSRSRWRRNCRDGAAARLNRSFSPNHRGRSDSNQPSPGAQLRGKHPQPVISNVRSYRVKPGVFSRKCSYSSLCLVH